MSYQIIKGPAVIRGQAVNNVNLRTKGDVKINKRIGLTQIDTDYIKNLDQRVEDVIHEINFTPAGMWNDASILAAAASYAPGQKVLNNVAATLNSVADAGGGVCTLTFSAAKTVYKGQYIYIATSSVGGYVGARLVTADSTGTTCSVAMTYSATATGTVKIPPCLIIHPLEQWAESEHIVIYQNAGITSLPAMNFSATETLLGDVTVSAVYHPFLTAADAESLLREATWAAVSSSVIDDFLPDYIFTDPPRIRYAAPDADEFTGAADSAAAPWKDFRSLNGIKANFSLTTAPDKTDYRGTQNWTIQNVGLTITGTPVSGQPGDEITAASIQALLRQQDDGADGLMRGKSTQPATPLELCIAIENTIATFKLRIPSAIVSAAGAAHGANAPRNSDLTWTAVRQVASGAASPLYAFED